MRCKQTMKLDNSMQLTSFLKTHFNAKITYVGIPALFLFLEPKFGCHYINCLSDTNTAMTIMILASEGRVHAKCEE